MAGYEQQQVVALEEICLMVVLGFLPEKKSKRENKAQRNTADMVTVLPEAPLE